MDDLSLGGESMDNLDGSKKTSSESSKGKKKSSASQPDSNIKKSKSGMLHFCKC